MTLNKRDVGVGLLVVALLAALVFSFEPYEQEIDRFSEPIVYSQPFLALQKSLEQKGSAFEVVEDFNSLFGIIKATAIEPKIDDVLVITEGEIALPKAKSDKILGWVDQGGHLVMGLTGQAGASVFSNNHLLKALGVETLSASGEDFSEFKGNTRINTQDFGEIEVLFGPEVYLSSYYDDEYAYEAYPIGSDDAYEDANYGLPTIVEIDYGEGLISLLIDTNIWKNFRLDDFDHAILAHEMLGAANKVFLVEYEQPTMWYTLISQYSPAFYWSGLLLIVVSLWYVAVRFGAIKSADNAVVTYFSQHIRAAGEFYWSNNQRLLLLKEARAQVFEEASTRVSSTHPSTEVLVAALAKLSMWPEETIHEMLIQEHENINQANFIKIMQGLKKLRKMI